LGKKHRAGRRVNLPFPIEVVAGDADELGRVYRSLAEGKATTINGYRKSS
jgi:hypothetical protein